MVTKIHPDLQADFFPPNCFKPEIFLADQRTASVIIPFYSLYQRHLLAPPFSNKQAQHIRQIRIKPKNSYANQTWYQCSGFREREGEQKAANKVANVSLVI